MADAPSVHGPWQRPDYTGDDIYPPFGCWDKMRAGGVNIGSTRQLVHDLLCEIVPAGWGRAVASYGEQACTPDDFRRFLHDLLDARGEFGRLLLTLAAAVKAEQDKTEADADRHFAEAHPGSNLCDCGDRIPLAWWADPDLSRPVADQLRRCLAVLEGGDDLTEVVAELGRQLGCDRSAKCPVCHHWVANGHAEDCAWTALVFLVEGPRHG